ncbi:MAG: L,D-transpeptidase family protein [Epulopiscium sp.]|nr:L,D-transpeptidase family protein [Candidatus Epulonipiscium sp.]
MIFTVHIKKYIGIIVSFIIFLCLILFLQHYHQYTIEINESHATISIHFFLPMKQERINTYFKIYPQIPKTKYSCDYEWKSNRHMVINIKELQYPKGQNVVFKIEGAPSYIPFLKKYFSISIPFQMDPKVKYISPEEQISTEGPIKIAFNTFINPKNIEQYIQSDMNLILEPIKIVVENQKYTDYSQWLCYPNQKLENNKSYSLILKEGLEAQNGCTMKKTVQKTFHTVSKPTIIKTFPKDDESWISFYPKIMIEATEPIKKAQIHMEGVKGETKVEGNIIEFLPDNLLKPDATYQVKVQMTSFYGEKSDPYFLNFTTMPLKEDLLWVEVSLKEYHEVIIYEGKKEVRRMKASGGTKEEPTVLGTFYLQDRGPYFFSERFGEGATFWVRIVDQYLFHGIPRNQDWNIIERERKKLGGPASHGCIRLSEEDALWFYENIPQGTMVIIHQ